MESLDNFQKFKHDFNNIMCAIGGYIKAGDMKGLQDYYSLFEKDYQEIQNVSLISPNIINNPGIYNLVNSKYLKAQNLGITLNLDIFFDFSTLQMPIYDFLKILGIFLDNAIEASSECVQKNVSLCFRESKKNHVQIISIENTFHGESLDIKKIFVKGISGKDNHSGIGLWEVNQIIKKYNNVILKTSAENNIFKQYLQIYY